MGLLRFLSAVMVYGLVREMTMSCLSSLVVNSMSIPSSTSSWSNIHTKVVKSSQQGPLVCYENDEMHMELLENEKRSNYIFFHRDLNGICPYSQRVWLALEHKGIMATKDTNQPVLVTVLTEDIDSVPRIQWPDGSTQNESLDILERIEKEFPPSSANGNFDLYAKVSGSVDGVRANVVRFNGIAPTYSGVFPRRVDLQNKYAPFLFRKIQLPFQAQQQVQNTDALDDTNDYELVPLNNHMVTVEEADEMLEEYEDGPFFCGDVVTAADLVWLPFMERYAIHLPNIKFPSNNPNFVFNPRSKDFYPAIHEWYDAIECALPCYSCRIQGDAQMWLQTLEKGIQWQQEKSSNDLQVPTKIQMNKDSAISIPLWKSPKGMNVLNIWKQYAKDRPYVADTPVQESVAFIFNNRELFWSKETSSPVSNKLSASEADEAMLELCNFLLQHDEGQSLLPYWGQSGTAISIAEAASKLSGNARYMLSSINEHISVPRDIGIIPATVIRSLAKAVPKPRIL